MARRFARQPAEKGSLQWALVKVEQLGIAPFNRLAHAMPRDYRGAAFSNWQKRQLEVTAVVIAKLKAEGAKVVENGSETRFAFAGVRSTSTMGLSGALRNWRTAAQKRLGYAS